MKGPKSLKEPSSPIHYILFGVRALSYFWGPGTRGLEKHSSGPELSAFARIFSRKQARHGLALVAVLILNLHQKLGCRSQTFMEMHRWVSVYIYIYVCSNVVYVLDEGT